MANSAKKGKPYTLGSYRPTPHDPPLSCIFPDWGPNTRILGVYDKYPTIVLDTRVILTVNHWSRRFYVSVPKPKDNEYA